MAQQHPRPPRRPSPAVYRRRRLAAGIVLLVVLGLLVWAGFALASLFSGSDDGQGAPQGSGTSAPGNDPDGTGGGASESGAPEGSAPASDAGEPSGAPESPSCVAGDVVVSAETDQSAYGANENPVLIMTVGNQGQAPCTVNVGTGQQEFQVLSGDDRIFNSSDCRTEPTTVELEIKPGGQETARFTWERVRSAPGCEAVATKPRPGTYVFTAKLGELTSNKAPFQLR
ncbi:hypothetical protein ACQ3I4_14270 [Zafaria sp. Z1313]|uniref:hypothetical protein n=1 Tax=unclassified Zafaria TaxID=2828765 RepID=UPI002E76C09F|nr:hypothetical protein [Zafaria sp. J156]MEE1622090.1 hypothetical protein [Zafaria sp. J156]